MSKERNKNQNNTKEIFVKLVKVKRIEFFGFNYVYYVFSHISLNPQYLCILDKRR